MRIFSHCYIFLSGLALAGGAVAADDTKPYQMEWRIALEAGNDLATITLDIADGRPVHDVSFDFDPQRFSDFSGEGKLTVNEGSVHWEPASKDARLQYKARITRERPNRNQETSYDALMTDDWALFRGDRLIPRMSVVTRKGAVAQTTLRFELPQGWSANTGWPLADSDDDVSIYRIDDPDRRFDRPTGWIMVGELGARRDDVGSTYFSVVAPKGSHADRTGWLTLASLVYPELERAFGKVPEKILMVSADDPMWRGGLSGPNSFYFHSSRRAISENGTSPLFHELTHVVTRLSGGKRDDWIVEGLAEYYSIELLRRAGGYDDDRKAAILDSLAKRGATVDKLRLPQSSGAITARAVGVLAALDREIIEATDGEANLDAVVRILMKKRRIGLDDLRDAFASVTDQQSTTLAAIE